MLQKRRECIEGTSFSVSKSNFSRNISPSVVFTFFSLISTGLLIFGVYCRKYDIDCRGILYEGQSVLDGRIGSEKTGHPTDTVLIEIVEETLKHFKGNTLGTHLQFELLYCFRHALSPLPYSVVVFKPFIESDLCTRADCKTELFIAWPKHS